MNLIDIDENNMMEGVSNNLGMKVTVEFPQELTEQQSDLKNDLLTILESKTDWKTKISIATKRMLMHSEVWKGLITLNFSEEAKNNKTAHFLATNWIKEQNDDLIHIVGMLKSKNCQLNNIKMEGKSKQERLALFLEEVGRSISHWAEVEHAINLMVERNDKDVPSTSTSLRMPTQGRKYTKALHQAYRVLIDESNMIKDNNANMHLHIKCLVESYYRWICEMTKVNEKKVEVVPIDQIFMHNQEAINIEGVLRGIERKFVKVMKRNTNGDYSPIISLLSDLKTILQNWDDIVAAEQTVRKIFYSKELENLAYNFNRKDENALEEFNEELDRRITHHIQQKDADILKAHAKIYGEESKTDYLLKIYHNLINLILEKGDIIKKAKQIEFSTYIDDCLDQDELYMIDSYKAEGQVQPFSEEKEIVVNNYGIRSQGGIFFYVGQMILLFCSKQADGIYASAPPQESSEPESSRVVSVLTKSIRSLGNKLKNIYTAFNYFEKLYIDRFAKKASLVGLSFIKPEHEYNELRTVEESTIEEDLLSTDDLEGGAIVGSTFEEDNMQLLSESTNASNDASILIGTEPQNSSLKIIYTVPFFILASFILGASLYSTVMGYGLLGKTIKISIRELIVQLFAFVIFLTGLKSSLHSIYTLIVTADDLRIRKTRGNIVCIFGIIVCTAMALGCGLVYPCTLDVQQVVPSLDWMLVSLLTTVAFITYTGYFKKEIVKEMRTNNRIAKFKFNVQRIVFYAITMAIFT
ncbi:hypothetical protein NEAUS03_2311, partial [Nematocida ausubeli]